MKRSWLAGAAGLVLAMLVWTGIGAQAGGLVVPATVRLPDVAAGDVLDQMLVTANGTTAWRAEVLGPDTVPDAQGIWRATTRVKWSGPAETTWWVDPQGMIVATGEGRKTIQATRPWAEPLPVELPATGSSEHVLRALRFSDTTAACLFMAPREWHPAAEPGAGLGGCLLTPGTPVPELAVSDVAAVHGPHGLRLVAAGRDRVVIDADHPYPAAISTAGVQWRIEAFARGTAGAWPAAPTGALPELAYAQRQAWGMDETGVEMLFPPSEAYQAAREDLEWRAFEAWAAANPEHVAVRASVWRGIMMDHHEFLWKLLFVAPGGESFPLQVVKSYPGSTLLGLPGETRAAGAYEFSRYIPDHGVPAYEEIPRQWPTLASVQARWQAASIAPDDLQLTAAPFSWRCEGTCGAADMRLSAWHWDGGISASLDTGDDWDDWVSSGLVMDGTGRGIELEESMRDERPFLAPGDAPATPKEAQAVEGPWVTPGARAAAAGLAGVAGALVAWLLAAGNMPWTRLFSRIADDRLLDHPVRAQIHQLVQAEPGIRFQELRRRLGVSNGAAVHHLQRLLDAGHIVATRQAGATSYTAPGVEARLQPALALLRARPRRRIMAACLEAPCPAADLLAAANVGRSALYEHLQRLRKGGLLERGPDGYVATETARALRAQGLA